MSDAALTRGELLRRAGLGVAAFGFAGPHRYTGLWLKHELRIMQWAHTTPGYDAWLDGTYAVRWGQANDTRVVVDHVRNSELPARAGAEVAAQAGHDLVQLLSPPTGFQKATVPMDDAVQEVIRRLGRPAEVAARSTYNPRTKHWFGFPDHYTPPLAVWRRDLWSEVGATPTSWRRVLASAHRLRGRAHPIGIGLATEPDSSAATLALLLSGGASIQDAAGRPALNSRQTLDVLKLVRDLYRTGMHQEVLDWDSASNNQFLYTGVGSLIVNPLSALRGAELERLPFAGRLELSPVPAGTAARLAPPHSLGAYLIWRFAADPELAKRYLVDQQLAYREHFVRSGFLDLPAWTGAVPGGFAAMRRLAGPRYAPAIDAAEHSTVNAGHPGYTNGAVGQLVDGYLVPHTANQVARGTLSPEEGARLANSRAQEVFREWREEKLI